MRQSGFALFLGFTFNENYANMLQKEHFFTCPSCLQNISIIVESRPGMQQFIEDCEVCCRPLEFTLVFEGEDLAIFEVKNLNN